MPAEPDRDWKLVDLIDLETLQSIQDTFARVFRLPTVIVDPAGRNLTEITHRLAFCEDLTRGNAVAGAQCQGCDQDAMSAAAASNRPEVFHCWNGLYDCAIPISPKGVVLGYFLCGQVLDSPPKKSKYRDTALGFGIDPDTYVEALSDVQVIPLDSYRASVDTMHVLAEMIAEQAAAAIDNFRTLQKAVDARSDAAALIYEFDGLLEAFGDIGSQPDHASTLEAARHNLERLVPCEASAIYLVDPDQDEVTLAVGEIGPDSIPVAAGLIGKVAATGTTSTVADSTSEPGAATLVAPLSHKGAVQGMAVLRRSGDSFNEHELRLVTMVMAAASVAVDASRLNVDMSRRLREEQLFSSLLRELSQRLTLDRAMTVVARAGISLLGASGAFIQSPASSHDPKTIRLNVEPEVVIRLGERLALDIDRAVARSSPVLTRVDEHPCVIVPFGSDSGPLGFGVFLDPDSDSWDLRVATALASHAALGLDNARMLEREHELSRRYRDLSELSTDLLGASGPAEVVDRLASVAPAILGSDVAAIVVLDGASSNATLATRSDDELIRFRIPLTTNARLAAVKLASGSGDPTLFQSWMEEVVVTAAEQLQVKSHLSEPLVARGEFMGGLLVGWHDRGNRWSNEERRLLGLMAAAAAGGVSQYTAYAATDAALRRRLAELQVLTDLAERVTAASGEDAVYEELTAAFRDLAQLDGAVFLVGDSHGWALRSSCGSVPSGFEGHITQMGSRRRHDQALTIDDDGISLSLSLGEGRSGLLAGWSSGSPDPSSGSALATLGRYAVVAMESSRLHQQQAGAIARLESANAETAQQYETAQRLLTVHRRVGEAALGPGGLAAMVSSLTELIEAPVIALRSDLTSLASWPQGYEPEWQPSEGPTGDQMTVQDRGAGQRLVAYPARIEQQTIGWLVTQLDREPTEVDEAILNHGALLTALVLLQEATGAEVETRLKGGFLDELLGGDFSLDRIRRQALALGYDLDDRGRVLTVEPTVSEVSEYDLNLLYKVVVNEAHTAGSRLVAATRGTRVVAVVADQDVDGDRTAESLEDKLESALRSRTHELEPNAVFGTVCEEPLDYQTSYAAATKGLGLLSAMGRRGSIFSFRSPGLEHLLLRSNEPHVILDFVARYVEPLREYDRTHTSDLQRTLEVFYESDLNLHAAARRLHIHVSTLRYRLTRASEILGLNPREGPTRLDVELGLRAAAVLQNS